MFLLLLLASASYAMPEPEGEWMMPEPEGEGSGGGCIPVNHVFDNPGQISCGCESADADCMTGGGCVPEPSCAPKCMHETCDDSGSDSGEGSGGGYDMIAFEYKMELFTDPMCMKPMPRGMAPGSSKKMTVQTGFFTDSMCSRPDNANPGCMITTCGISGNAMCNQWMQVANSCKCVDLKCGYELHVDVPAGMDAALCSSLTCVADGMGGFGGQSSKACMGTGGGSGVMTKPTMPCPMSCAATGMDQDPELGFCKDLPNCGLMAGGYTDEIPSCADGARELMDGVCKMEDVGIYIKNTLVSCEQQGAGSGDSSSGEAFDPLFFEAKFGVYTDKMCTKPLTRKGPHGSCPLDCNMGQDDGTLSCKNLRNCEVEMIGFSDESESCADAVMDLESDKCIDVGGGMYHMSTLVNCAEAGDDTGAADFVQGCVPVNHQFDNPGQISCGCESADSSCFIGGDQAACVPEPQCASQCMRETCDSSSSDSGSGDGSGAVYPPLTFDVKFEQFSDAMCKNHLPPKGGMGTGQSKFALTTSFFTDAKCSKPNTNNPGCFTMTCGTSGNAVCQSYLNIGAKCTCVDQACGYQLNLEMASMFEQQLCQSMTCVDDGIGGFVGSSSKDCARAGRGGKGGAMMGATCDMYCADTGMDQDPDLAYCNDMSSCGIEFGGVTDELPSCAAAARELMSGQCVQDDVGVYIMQTLVNCVDSNAPPAPTPNPTAADPCVAFNKKKLCKKGFKKQCTWDKKAKACLSKGAPAPPTSCSGNTNKRKCNKANGCAWDKKQGVCATGGGTPEPAGPKCKKLKTEADCAARADCKAVMKKKKFNKCADA